MSDCAEEAGDHPVIHFIKSTHKHETWAKSVLRFFFHFLTDFSFLSGATFRAVFDSLTDKIWIYAEAAMHLSFQWVWLYTPWICVCASWVLITAQPLVDTWLRFLFKWRLSVVVHLLTLKHWDLFFLIKWLNPILAPIPLACGGLVMVLDSH